MKFYYIAVLFLAGCTSMQPQTPTTITEIPDVSGNIIKRVTTQSSAATSDQAMYSAVAECFKAQQTKRAAPSGLTAQEQMMYQMIQGQTELSNTLVNALAGIEPCNLGMNSNEAKVALEGEYTKRFGLVGDVFGTVAKWHYGVEGIGILADVFGKGGVVINGNDNQVRGVNTGQDGTANYVEQTAPYAGIPLEQGQVNPITLGSEADGEEEAESLAQQCESPPNNGTWVPEESRCSDGVGGTIEL